MRPFFACSEIVIWPVTFGGNWRFPPPLISSFARKLESWLKINCLSSVEHKSSSPWSILFPFVVWSLWKNRSKVVFENIIPNPNLHKVCIREAIDYFYCVGKSKQLSPKVVVPIKWTKPLVGWHKLNTEGAFLENPGKSGGRGIIRDSHGHWVKGFLSSIGYTTRIISNYYYILGCQRSGITRCNGRVKTFNQ